jgi:hypothetical protein
MPTNWQAQSVPRVLMQSFNCGITSNREGTNLLLIYIQELYNHIVLHYPYYWLA